MERKQTAGELGGEGVVGAGEALKKAREKIKKKLNFFLPRVEAGEGLRGWTNLKEPCQKFRCEARLPCNLSKTAGTSLEWRRLRATANLPEDHRKSCTCCTAAGAPLLYPRLAHAAERMQHNGAVIYQASRGID